MEVQPQLILLQKTLLNIEGLGRDLYPELDIWKTASPILRDWMKERNSVRAVLKSVRNQLPELLDAARALPPIIRGAIHKAQDGTLRLGVEAREIESLKQSLREANRRRNMVTVGSAILLGGLVWLGVGNEAEAPGWVMLALGAGWLLAAWRR